jgi:hypothetical protein
LSYIPDKTPTEIRREAARLARNFAAERRTMGDPEGAEGFRDLAREIEGIRISERKRKGGR